jgi:predicted TIM-barrel fold metal-dependent hydrolase
VAEKTSFYKQGWSDLNLLLKNLDSLGIEKAVLLYPTSDAHLNFGGWDKLAAVYNAEIAKVVKSYPKRLLGCGILPIGKQQDMIVTVKKIKDLGLLGLSLASSYEAKYLDEAEFLPVLKEAEKENLVVFIHSQTINPIGFERVKDPLLMPVVEYVFDLTMCVGKLLMSGRLGELKNLKIVFAHFAGALPFLFDRFDSTYAMLRARNMVKDLGNVPSQILKNIFVDTSGVKSAAVLNLALEVFGAEKILWGSDYPAKKDLRESIAAIENLGIAAEEKEKIFSRNLASLVV